MLFYNNHKRLITKKSKLQVTKILFIGTILYRKGIFDLLEAIKTLQNNNHKIKLLIAGSGPTIAVKVLKNRIYKLRLKAKYLGPVSFKEKWQLFKQSDIFCLPSYQDAYPSVILEAMICGLPIITTKQIDSPIIHGKSGYLINTGDINGLAEALIKLIQNPKIAFKMKQYNIIAARSLSSSSQAEKFVKLYRRLLK